MPNSYKTLGLTLGGGGTKGFAHLGFYQALYDESIPIHSVAGCSIGALIGAGIAQGKTPKEIEEVMANYVNENGGFFRLSNLSLEHGAFLKGEEEMKTLRQLIPDDLDFKDLKIPLVVNAVDLESGEEHAFKTGNVAKAVQASMAVPGVFPPVFIDGHLYVDGGIINSIPIDKCKELGADVQVVVDLKSFYTEQNISGLIYHFYMEEEQDLKDKILKPKKRLKEAMLKASFPFHVMLRSICIAEESRRKSLLEKYKPEFLVHPDVSSYNFLDTSDHLEIYQKGLEAGKLWVPKIRQFILNPTP